MFRAFDQACDRLVAVKWFRLDLAPERAHQLVSELERLIAAAPAQPAIVAPIAAGLDGVVAYLAEEYVVGESLDLMLRQSGALAPATVVGAAAQLAAALDGAAAVNIEHGVLHPRDVLLAGDEAKLTGLGIARALEHVGIPTPVRRPYTAPERLVGSSWDRRADVYGLAVLVYEMLWGRRVAAAGDEAADGLTDIAGGDLPRLRALFGRALADDPAQRFDTALEFAGGLALAFPEATGLRPPSKPQPMEHPASVPRIGSVESVLQLPLEIVRDAPADVAPDARFDGGADLDLFNSEPAILDMPSNRLELDLPPMPASDPVIRRDVPRASLSSLSLSPQSSLSSVSSPPGDSYHAVPANGTPEDRSRSAISPLAAALVVGAALGFAVGFGVGSRDRSTATIDPRTPPVDGREFSEAGVAPAGETGVVASTPAAASAARPQADASAGKPEPAPNGSVLVRSAPDGATVLVDGRDFGRTPVTVRGLTRGAHRVEIVRDGYTAEARQIAITPAQPAHSMTVRLSPERSVPSPPAPAAVAPAPQAAAPAPARTTAPLKVESRPTGAKVFLDNRLAGVTPLVVPDVAAGDHAVTLELDGYRRWMSPVRVTPSAENRVTASLDR